MHNVSGVFPLALAPAPIEKKNLRFVVDLRQGKISKRLGTVKPVKLGALEGHDFLLLFNACAVDNNNYEEHRDIGYQIVAKSKGNPLAAESAAQMLREQPTLGHWKSIIKNGVWESLQLRGGIVTTLKISYYQLPYQLQQCFLFCSIFPSDHQFHIDDLVSMWISLGFVKSIQVGRDHFNALVNSCLLEDVETKDSILLNEKRYVVCGMMHEFARLVSTTEFATIDGLECEEVLLIPTVRHLLIQTDSVNHVDECGTIVGNMKFQEKLQSTASSLRRLRTLILIGLGHYDHVLMKFQSFHTFISNLVNCTHLRYLKLEYKGMSESLPIPLSKYYHLEMLHDRCGATVHDMSDLIIMRHLVLTEKALGASFPAMSSSLQTIHLEDCKGLEIFPSLESLSSLTKLRLRNMPEVTKVLLPSLEELMLIDMPKLDRCFSNSVRDLNSSLRVLEIRTCRVLKIFPLFESCEILEIEQKSWLPNVSELTIHECPHLMVSNPLPPSRRFCKLSIKKVSVLPKMKGSSDVELRIGSLKHTERYSLGLILDDKILSFRNLRTITQLEIVGCENLWSISLEGFMQLVCLKRLEIKDCEIFFSSDVPSTDTHEDMAETDFDALPSLQCLSFYDCGITGEWLSVMLQHVRALEGEQITGLLIEGKENSLSNLTLAQRASSQGNPDGALTRSCPDELLHIPSNLVPSLKKMSIKNCEIKFQGNREGFSGFTSLKELRIVDCPELIPSLVHEDEIDDQANGRWLLPCSLGVLYIEDASLGTLQPCFPGDLTRLKVLEVSSISGLKSLRLHSCTALEKLKIRYCKSLDALEGFQSLRSLKYLKVYRCPVLSQCLESLSTQGDELCPRLERLRIDDPSFLTTPFYKHLTSVQCLQLGGDEYEYIDAAGLTCEQEAALLLLTSLQELRFEGYYKLSDLPVGLHSFLSLKRLAISYCPNISRLPERGLPPSLEELEVCGCSEELTEQCRTLATSKLKVIIDEEYVKL
jgi:hypothetical protein